MQVSQRVTLCLKLGEVHIKGEKGRKGLTRQVVKYIHLARQFGIQFEIFLFLPAGHGDVTAQTRLQFAHVTLPSSKSITLLRGLKCRRVLDNHDLSRLHLTLSKEDPLNLKGLLRHNGRTCRYSGVKGKSCEKFISLGRSP